MGNIFKNKIVTVFVVLATIALAGVAVFTAIRLYQLRQESVAPTAPESKPQAVEPPTSCQTLTFTIGAAAGTPTPTPTATATTTASPAPTATATARATATATARATATPIAQATATPPSLPVAGTSWPTIVGIGVGILAIFGAILLAL